MASHKGECFCGAVKIEVSGDPEAMGYCQLPIVPIVVRRPGQRFLAMEARGGEGHRGR